MFSMPIPDFDANGFLPVGVFDCTLDEIRDRFTSNMQRRVLFKDLQFYVGSVQKADRIVGLMVDGSFTTDDPSPSDIDLIVIIDGSALNRAMTPFEYGVMSARRVAKRYSALELQIVRENSVELRQYIEHFQKVKHRPGMTKGLLKVIYERT